MKTLGLNSRRVKPKQKPEFSCFLCFFFYIILLKMMKTQKCRALSPAVRLEDWPSAPVSLFHNNKHLDDQLWQNWETEVSSFTEK